MKVYIEYILIENLILNYFIIYQISIFIKIHPKLLNKFLGIILLSVYTTIAYVLQNDFISNSCLKILLVNVSVYIIYTPKNIIEYIKQNIYFYSIYFLYIGIIISVTLIFNINISKVYIRILIYIVSFILLHVFNNFMWKMWKTNIKEKELAYKIIINEFEIQAFVDTGHSVKDYISNLDIIFIDNYFYKLLFNKGLLDKKTIINFNTIEKECIQEGYIIKKVKFIKEDKEYYIDKIILIFTDNKINNNLKYKAIIGYDTYLEKLKGVTLC